jgi:hypothetical protein
MGGDIGGVKATGGRNRLKKLTIFNTPIIGYDIK